MTESLFPREISIQARPLAFRLAPRRLEDFSGQKHLLSPGKILFRLIESRKFSSAIFYGPPGCGKTALARLAALYADADTVEINAAVAGVADLKKAIEEARYRLSLQNRRTLLLVDEIHHFNRTQQDVLLPSTERGEILLIGMTTENPSFYVNAALLSRVAAFEFKPLSDEDLREILERALENEEGGLKGLSLKIDSEAKDHLIRVASGDARRLLNALELAASSTPPDSQGFRTLSVSTIEDCVLRRALRYDKKSDDHYDHISAFIKSLRGSDPDAALYWMAKMIQAGEDPRFIARRLLICASEDVGNADFRALLIASSAASAVERLGMPEARIILSEAALYIACAPKSNASYLAIDAALQEVETGPVREVPDFLRDSNLDSKTRGHGVGYKYPHDYPHHYVAQEYLPNPIRFYQPTDEGDEKRLAQRLKELRASHES